VISKLKELEVALDIVSEVCGVDTQDIRELFPFSYKQTSNQSVYVASQKERTVGNRRGSFETRADRIQYRLYCHVPYGKVFKEFGLIIARWSAKEPILALLESQFPRPGLCDKRSVKVWHSGDRYEGDFVDNEPQGLGVCRYANDSRTYRGAWSNGRRLGYGEVTWPDGRVLKGSFMDEVAYGVLTWRDSRVYEGQLVNDEMSGLGVLIWTDDLTISSVYGYRLSTWYSEAIRKSDLSKPVNCCAYIGQFRDNMMNGYGFMLKESGDYYEGEWCNAAFHGQGAFVLPNHDFYIGRWVEGVMQGYGTSKNYQGMHRQGLKHGVGKLEKPTGTYEGNFVGNEEQGYCSFKVDGETYDGEWSNGKPHGQGAFTWANGDSYGGKWEKGVFSSSTGTLSKRDGRVYKGPFNATVCGEMLWPDGAKYKGDIKIKIKVNAHLLSSKFNIFAKLVLVRDGQGSMTWVNGDCYRGRWEDDIKEGCGVYTQADGTVDNEVWIKGEKKYVGHIELHGGDLYYGDILGGVPTGKGIVTYLSTGNKYEGIWAKGRIVDGLGNMTYADGGFYSGKWVSGLRSGYGVMQYSNGDHFKGNWVIDRRMDGVLSYAGGEVYVGRLVNDMKDAPKAKMTWPCGDWYEGEWRNDKMDGEGCFMKSNVGSYSGSFSVGMRDGYGVYEYTNGDRYEGEWTADLMHGEGFVFKVSQYTYSGAFVEGKRHGYGVITFPSGDHYQGRWRNDLQSGRGKLTKAEGEVYEGQFIDGQLTGYGVMTFTEGVFYEGYWLDGKFHGQGLYSLNNDVVYAGSWASGKSEGFGVQKLPDGSSLEGQWKAGFLIDDRTAKGVLPSKKRKKKPSRGLKTEQGWRPKQ
jgi:hypothetical protein